MMDNESQDLEKIYDFNILDESSKKTLNKGSKMKKTIENTVISEYIPNIIKKKIFVGFQLLIIAIHITFFILRILRV